MLAVFQTASTAKQLSVVLTTSLLETALDEIKPESSEIEVFRILPPGACPGHFDISPRIVPVLKSSSLIIRHDYQKVLEDKIGRLGVDTTTSLVVATKGTPLIPEHYASIVTQIGDMYAKLDPGAKNAVASNVSAVTNKLETLNSELETYRSRFRGKKIIAAVHVRAFCEWLGFEVIGVLKRPEESTPRDFEKLAGLNAVMIAGNLQEGSKSAVSLAERMGIPVAVLSNFPGAENYGATYFDLIHENVKRLDQACPKR